MITGTGIIRYNDFEGGFYTIEAEDGKIYDVVGLPNEFKQDGLRVSFKVDAENAPDIGFHMRGDIVNFVEMTTL